MKQAISVTVKEKKDIELWTVKWKNRPNGEEMTLKSFDFPRPELPAALSAFIEFIPDILMIPRINIRWCEIAGANFGYDKKGRVHLSLGVAVQFQNLLEIKFVSPELLVDLDQDEDTAEDWRERYSVLARVLNDEIIRYAEGDRAQLKLDFEGEENESLCKENGPELEK